MGFVVNYSATMSAGIRVIVHIGTGGRLQCALGFFKTARF
jgi:hypothetical protein